MGKNMPTASWKISTASSAKLTPRRYMCKAYIAEEAHGKAIGVTRLGWLPDT
jgi:hypothetical protein